MRQLQKGVTYRITVQDKSSIHNVHLAGGGVNRKTTVPGTGTVVWTVRFTKRGNARVVCDPHASAMVQTFRIV